MGDWWRNNLSPAQRWMVVGAIVGVVVGFLFGGVGVAARGGAVGIPGSLIFGLIGGFIGYKLQKRGLGGTTPKG